MLLSNGSILPRRIWYEIKRTAEKRSGVTVETGRAEIGATLPTIALENGFQFRHTTIDDALAEILGTRSTGTRPVSSETAIGAMANATPPVK